MAQIGTFIRNSDGSYTGEIVTLWIQAKNVRIEEVGSSLQDSTITHRVTVGRAEIGFGQLTISEDGQSRLALTLDDPSFDAPINATLVDDPEKGRAVLLWSRAILSN